MNSTSDRRYGSRLLLAIMAILIGAQRLRAADDVPTVSTLRAPDKGIQPQVALDDTGRVHLIYLTGDARAADINYVTLGPGETQFSAPRRVNSQAGSALAIGNIRGPQLAVGKDRRVHVAWNGSGTAEPKAPGQETPMLYSRLSDAGDAFEPQRNVIQKRVGLDGGGAIAADAQGNVYVVWHAFDDGPRNEANRRLWVSKSTNGGQTFAAEVPASPAALGCCGCCGMRAAVDEHGKLLLLFRSATEGTHRDMYLSASSDQCDHFTTEKIDSWEINQCVMSLASLLPRSKRTTLAAWEAREQVYWSELDAAGRAQRIIAAPASAKRRKYPTLATNAQGQILLAWTENMNWNAGGNLVWQVFDSHGKPISGAQGSATGVPAWSLVATFARADGSFVVIY